MSSSCAAGGLVYLTLLVLLEVPAMRAFGGHHEHTLAPIMHIIFMLQLIHIHPVILILAIAMVVSPSAALVLY